MDQTVLVDIERNSAARAAALILEKSPEVEVIVVAKFAEYSSPRLVVASSAFSDHSAISNYMKFGSMLRQIDEEDDDPPSLLLMSMNDPFVVALQRSVGHVERSRGLHLAGQSLGNRFLEDGYVYRVN